MVGHYPPARRGSAIRFWLVAIVAGSAAALTLYLGTWQLSRATEKLALQQQIAQRAVLPALDDQAVGALPAHDPSWMYRRVELRGRWLHRYTLYLDNRQMDGRQGFFVLTPLQLADAARTVVMVQRGWVQRNFERRTALPVLVQPEGEVLVQGRIAPPPAKLYEFAGPAPGNIRQNLDLVAYARETGLALASFCVLETGAASDGLARDWVPVDTGVDKHRAYAFQWFALCALIVLLFVWFQVVRRFFHLR